ncbi:hypothetical protein BTVI_57349 [Pitangus sulphuratus]|nr:hypothetical protein BTVI_57349 [Pitangus sulphuratus]
MSKQQQPLAPHEDQRFGKWPQALQREVLRSSCILLLHSNQVQDGTASAGEGGLKCLLPGEWLRCLLQYLLLELGSNRDKCHVNNLLRPDVMGNKNCSTRRWWVAEADCSLQARKEAVRFQQWVSSHPQQLLETLALLPNISQPCGVPGATQKYHPAIEVPNPYYHSFMLLIISVAYQWTFQFCRPHLEGDVCDSLHHIRLERGHKPPLQDGETVDLNTRQTYCWTDLEPEPRGHYVKHLTLENT